MTTPVIRVFPRRTSFTPDDSHVFIGMPPMPQLIPKHSEVHVSCVFTWDKELCEELAYQWESVTDKPVLLGGPAYNSLCEDFAQGLYLKSNIIFTSRGCNNACPWCCVPEREGGLRELPIVAGNWIQDNNFLQTSRTHKDKVFDMLRTQKGICFKGGLECNLIDDHFVGAITSLRIAELWLACGTDDALPTFKRAAAKLARAGFNREKIKCYALIGDDMDKNEARLREIYDAGAMPFAQLYQPLELSDMEVINGQDKREYDSDWRAFVRMWSRPAATKAHVEKGTSYQDFGT